MVQDGWIAAAGQTAPHVSNNQAKYAAVASGKHPGECEVHQLFLQDQMGEEVKEDEEEVS
jgi:hypothetical protein